MSTKHPTHCKSDRDRFATARIILGVDELTQTQRRHIEGGRGDVSTLAFPRLADAIRHRIQKDRVRVGLDKAGYLHILDVSGERPVVERRDGETVAKTVELSEDDRTLPQYVRHVANGVGWDPLCMPDVL